MLGLNPDHLRSNRGGSNIPTKTRARTWAPSSVKALLDRARDQGLLDLADGEP
ncbi:hypothetical protein MCW82_28000 [Azospirillum doebereinerae]|uniref:hypothetical protein n=1 Tax=Azospirillum doebereinerae TaxID=92933 RepID=UPI001EE5540D|nr:hypothetical protein [Azospirillum doebereinerae]MCG5243628.1 hypothetical protein [Azospirillum doebereinerae]